MTDTSKPIEVLVWDEAPKHAPKDVYPDSLNGAIVEGLHEMGGNDIAAVAVNLDQNEQGMVQSAIDEADVIIWWGHARHGEVSDETAKRVIDAVVSKGKGFIALHSAHYSKPFRGILNCNGHLKGGWRESKPADTEELTVCAPRHPITQGVSDFSLPAEEMYGAPFDVPPAQVVIFQSYFPQGGEYFPSFVTTVGEGIDPNFTSGGGKGANQGEGIGRVFYFRPGHEEFPTYYNENVRRVLYNAVKWAAKRG